MSDMRKYKNHRDNNFVNAQWITTHERDCPRCSFVHCAPNKKYLFTKY